jgi:hypothetical protein
MILSLFVVSVDPCCLDIPLEPKLDGYNFEATSNFCWIAL